MTIVCEAVEPPNAWLQRLAHATNAKGHLPASLLQALMLRSFALRIET